MISLQATWIRNSIRHALRTTAKVETRTVSSTFVYKYPTISSLVTYVVSLANGTSATQTDAAAVDEMNAMAEKYSTFFPQHTPSPLDVVNSVGDIVLVTGTTGALGSYILSMLAASSSVSRVYAFNRKARDGTKLKQRQIQAVTSRGIDTEFLNGGKVVLVEGDLSEVGLGIRDQLLQEVWFVVEPSSTC